jgi:tRNA-Thr(GGU) m(6)t(6)A37 methyltransferase TsaA
MTAFQLRVIGHVSSPLRTPAEAPRQGDEGAPDADLVFADDVVDGLRNLAVGEQIIVLTWLHEGDRSVLAVHPRGDPNRPLTGVFSTRSPDRPNPIGLHRVTVLGVHGPRVHVSGIEAIDGTPIVDVKPVLGDVADR